MDFLVMMNKMEKELMGYERKFGQKFSLLSSKKTLWFLKGKVASSYITFMFNKDSSFDMLVDFNNPLNIIDPRISSRIDETLKRSYHDAFENNPEKQSVTLIRNPHKRFLSGFITDFFLGLLTKTSHLPYLLHIGVDKEEIKNKEDFLRVLKMSGSTMITQELMAGEFEDIWKMLIYKQLEYTFTSGVDQRTAHTDPWISFVYVLHKEYLKDNLKIYDIDRTNLSEILKLHADEDELYNDTNTKVNQELYFNKLANQVYNENSFIKRKLDDILFDESRLYKELIKNVYGMER